MSSFVPVACKNALYDLGQLLPAALATRPQRLASFERICALYRRLAVGSLLIAGDPRDFFAYLFRSARAFVHFAEGAPEAERLASKAAPFLDAIACRDDEGARRIAAAMPRQPSPGREYEEDFYYLRVTMDLAGDDRMVDQMLAAWGALVVAGPVADPRLDVCAALMARDQAQFDAATDAAILGIQRTTETRRKADDLPADEAATTAHVSVDVLAWLELADRRGMDSSRDRALAPSLARAFHRASPPSPDSWRRLP